MLKDKYTEQQLASFWDYKFKNAMIAKAQYTKLWQTYIDAYNGDYFKNEKLPDYKSNLVSNYIFSIIETIRPLMLENDPKFQAMPRQPEGMSFSSDLQEALSYEWDREGMRSKLYRELINCLTIGTAIFFIPWDSKDKNVKAIPINAFNFFPDPLATSIDDAEYLIYASYKNVQLLKRLFPNRAKDLTGSSINYSELVADNDKDAQINNQVLVLEVYTKDYESVELAQGDDKTFKPKYPNGRVITLCPELGIVLSDKELPYKDGKFPFCLIKDYDIPNKFWGEGEVAQLLSPQKYMNELNNSILDNAKATANMPWIVDKNAGIGYGTITNRPGLIIRKNPGSDVRREQPPNMPIYVINAVETYKSDMEQISGIFNTVKGNSETGVYTAQGILALQEAGQVRVRLKVKLLEESLGTIAQMWYSRMKQFWNKERWINVVKPDGSYDMKLFTTDPLKYDYDIKITAGSTMPVNRSAMLDLMIRLAQTPMPDGQPLVDREAVVQYLPEEIKSALMRRMSNNNVQLEQLAQAVEQIGQQMSQLTQESQANDEQTIGAIEQITSAIEHLNEQILQLQEKHANIELERKKEEELNKIKSESYNSGYTDAEKLFAQSENEEQLSIFDEENSVLEEEDSVIPEELLQGLESLSDDELALIIKQNPELVELINK